MSITITSNISDMDEGSVAYAVCFQDSEFTDVANVESAGRAAVIRYVMDNKDVVGGPVVQMTVTGSPSQFSANLTREAANVDTPPGDASSIDMGVVDHYAYVVTQSGKFNNAFQVKHVPITIELGEWVLVARDYPNTTAFGSSSYTNTAGDFGDSTVLASAYSRFYSLYSSDTGAGDFNDTEIKSRGYYEFKWIPYFTPPGVTSANRVNPVTDTLFADGTDTVRYIQWTQTGNPLKTDTDSGDVTGFSLIEQQNVDVTLGTGLGEFNGLALSESTVNTVLDGNGKVGNWYHSCGTITAYSLGIPWQQGVVPDSMYASELYVRKI